MRAAMILTLVLCVMLLVHAGAAASAQLPCLPPGISPEFLSWPSQRVIPKTEAEVIPGDTIMYRNAQTGARVMIVKVNGIVMIVDPTPDGQLIDFWVRVALSTASSCRWERSRERAA